jgi:hypothetical protein
MTPYSSYGPREARLTRAVGLRTGPPGAADEPLCRADGSRAMIARDDLRLPMVVRPPSRAALNCVPERKDRLRMPSPTIPLLAVPLGHDDD